MQVLNIIYFMINNGILYLITCFLVINLLIIICLCKVVTWFSFKKKFSFARKILNKSSSFVTKKNILFVFCTLCLLLIINVKYTTQNRTINIGLNYWFCWCVGCWFVVFSFGVLPKEYQSYRPIDNES